MEVHIADGDRTNMAEVSGEIEEFYEDFESVMNEYHYMNQPFMLASEVNDYFVVYKHKFETGLDVDSQELLFDIFDSIHESVINSDGMKPYLNENSKNSDYVYISIRVDVEEGKGKEKAEKLKSIFERQIELTNIPT
jgi:hypothetical protein